MTALRRIAALLIASIIAAALPECTPGQDGVSDDAKPSAPTTAAAPPVTTGPGRGLSLADAIGKLEMAGESRSGYEREKFEHWTDADDDGCDTRKEVLISEAIEAPGKSEDCDLSGGRWMSYYDEETVTDDGDLDIDHMVPLAEAWDSGASTWPAQRREAFANDVDAASSLVAVTAGSNRSKSDRDPAQWLPSVTDVHCTYAADWTATKLRWALTADAAERDALEKIAGSCPDIHVRYEPAT